MKPVVLITDFGLRDGFVGALKGVMLSINPNLQIVDLSHEVSPFEILEGALLLKAHYRYFPKGSIFVGVVDPGVGSQRRGMILETDNYLFVGPENGLFDLVLKEEGNFRAYEIGEKYTLPRKNNTFHGRDVFAPVAAHLSLGVKPSEIGRKVNYRFFLNYPKPINEGDKVIGEIVYFDRYGNAVTNVPCGNFRGGIFRGESFKVVPFFLAGERDKLNSTCGSFGLMELFVPQDSARERFSLKKGERVVFLKKS